MLFPAEQFWADYYEQLKDLGYRLRPRYNPSPTTQVSLEDDITLPGDFNHIIDARDRDSNIVVLKHLRPDEHPLEEDVLVRFSATRTTENHCPPLLDRFTLSLDALDQDSFAIIVMPFYVPYKAVKFATVGEIVDFVGQMIEGLHFMHKQRIVHRNITSKNILMNPKGLFPNGVHPITAFGSQRIEHLGKRTMCPTRYYFVDFGRAQSSSQPNLFDADVVALGRVFEEDLVQKASNLSFLRPLVDIMANRKTRTGTDDASLAIHHVKHEYETLLRSLLSSEDQLRSRVVWRNESTSKALYRDVRHFFRKRKFANREAIPSRNLPS